MAEIPDCILLDVFEYLTISELCLGVRQVCRQWNRLSYDLSLWKHLPLSSYSEVITSWDIFINAFSNILVFVEVLDFSNCEQLFHSDDKLLWDHVLSTNRVVAAVTDSEPSAQFDDEKIDRYNSNRPFQNLKKIVFPVNSVDLGFIQMLCILKEHFPHLNAFERAPNVEASEFLSVLSTCNGLWREVHLPSLEVSVATNQQEPWETCVDFFKKNPQLKVLTLSSSDIDDNDFSAMCRYCSQIEKLNISNCLGIQESIKDIHNLKCLRNLNVSDTIVNDRVISEVSKQALGLSHVNISGCYKITDVGVGDLVKHAPQLHTLILNNVENNHANITDSGLAEIGKYGQNIRRLEMCNCPNVSDPGICFLTEGCQKLSYIDISGCLALTDKAIIDIAKHCKLLKSLSAFGCSHLTSVGINALVSSCPMLRMLDISTCHYVKGLNFEGLDSEEASAKQSFVSSMCLELNGNTGDVCPSGTDVSNSEVHKLTQQLKLENESETIPWNSLVQDILCLSKTRLTFLDLSNCSMIANDSVKQIARHCLLLRYMSLRGCNRVQDSGVTAVLQSCKLLQAIDLSGSSLLQASRLTDDALSSIGHFCRNLVMLDITKTPRISLAGIKDAIHGCQTLKRLRVSLHPNHIPLYDVVHFLHETRGEVTFSHNSLQKSVPEILQAGPNCKSIKAVNNCVLRFAAKAHSIYTHGMLY